MNPDYIQDHINRIETTHGGNPTLIADSQWRIASNADLFPTSELNPDGTLTSEQTEQVEQYIERFIEANQG